MSLLDITGLSHSYGDSRLYSDSDLSLNRVEHMGIVGQNGTGKVTYQKEKMETGHPLIQGCVACSWHYYVIWTSMLCTTWLFDYGQSENHPFAAYMSLKPK